MAATLLPENRAVFESDEIVRATSAQLVAKAERAIYGVSTDSRSVAPGNLFVAIVGEHHDAHAYLPQAIEKGASAVIVQRAPADVPAGVGVFVVDDCVRALGALAALHRRRFDIPIVAITGSVGKTTTKELIAAALMGLGKRVAFTQGNLNNRIGVPMTLLTIGSEHDAAVVELGMSVPGEIADLTAMVAPSIAVVTSVAEVHTEGVGGIDGVAREKGALLVGLDAEGIAVVCIDEPMLAPYAERSNAKRKVSYGRGEDADVRLVRWELDGGTRAFYRLPAPEDVLEVNLALIGGAAALDAAGALAVVHALEPAGIDRAAAALSTVVPRAHRMVPLVLPSGYFVIDDTYNASPRSTMAALDTAALLAEARQSGVCAVLGDMLELGAKATQLHEEVGRAAVRAGVSVFIACGELMAHAGQAALRATMERSGKRTKVVLLKNVEDAADCVRELARAGDVVLVKGSRGMRMERVVEALSSEALA